MKDFVSVFGNEINVTPSTRKNQVQYTGTAGTHGIVGLALGSRGYTIHVQGVLRSSKNVSYAQGRAELAEKIHFLEECCYLGNETWVYGQESYDFVRMESVRITSNFTYITGPSEHVRVSFEARLRGML